MSIYTVGNIIAEWMAKHTFSIILPHPVFLTEPRESMPAIMGRVFGLIYKAETIKQSIHLLPEIFGSAWKDASKFF